MGLRAGNGHQCGKACLRFLDFGLDIVNGIGRLDLEGEGDGLASEATGARRWWNKESEYSLFEDSKYNIISSTRDHMMCGV